jgi:hypothetical protein
MPIYCVILSLGRGKKKHYDDLTDYLERQTEHCVVNSQWQTRLAREGSERVFAQPRISRGFHGGVQSCDIYPKLVVENVWLVKKESSAREVREMFRPFLDCEDFICVIPVAEQQGWFARMGDSAEQQEPIDWLLRNLGIDY